MATIKVKCPYCGSEEVSLYGKNSTGKQRYLCRNKACVHKTFQMEYENNACRPGMREKEDVVESLVEAWAVLQAVPFSTAPVSVAALAGVFLVLLILRHHLRQADATAPGRSQRRFARISCAG